MNSPLLGRVIAEALVLAGVGEVVICPGSRSAAIAVGLAQAATDGGLRLHTRSDERAGGFLALGLARSTGSAAIVVTSGTAVGNLMPAVMEARHAGVPLVVITADRPATLVGSGANQTTEQVGIFGDHVVDDLRLASTDAAPDAWFAGMARVIHSALGTRTRNPGPVHVNAALTEPFLADQVTFNRPAALHIAASEPAPATALPAGPQTIVLAGDASLGVGRRARQFAEQARLPLFAEPSSNARGGDCAIAGYRLLLDGELGAQIGRVVCFGHPTLSRPVTRLLGRADVEVVMVSDRSWWPDPAANVSMVCDDVTLEPQPEAWLDAWRAADRDLPAPNPDGLISGVELAAAVVAHATGNLVLGSSNPVRDADLAPIGPANAVCWANRGLSGIDGVIATATGIMLGTGEPTTVLLGDLGFLHDIGSLHIPTGQPVPDLRVVVADDDGGGIFRTLEVAGSDWFEPLFAMPHGRDLGAIASGFGWPTRTVTDRAELVERLSAPINGIEVLVVPIDPERAAVR